MGGDESLGDLEHSRIHVASGGSSDPSFAPIHFYTSLITKFTYQLIRKWAELVGPAPLLLYSGECLIWFFGAMTSLLTVSDDGKVLEKLEKECHEIAEESEDQGVQAELGFRADSGLFVLPTGFRSFGLAALQAFRPVWAFRWANSGFQADLGFKANLDYFLDQTSKISGLSRPACDSGFSDQAGLSRPLFSGRTIDGLSMPI